MSIHLEKAEMLRNAKERHYNCAQSVLIPFAGEAGLDEETAYRIASGFGSGMKTGKVCGAITGGAMVLGLLGLDSPENMQRLFREIQGHHEGVTDCRNLLALNARDGGEKKPHCDQMVYEVIGIVDRMIEE